MKLLPSSVFFKSLPDFLDLNQAYAYLQASQYFVQNSQISEHTTFSILQGTELVSAVQIRQFTLAIFLADLSSYTQLQEQVSWEHLIQIVKDFPQGFRVFGISQDQQIIWPVGYTGWHPITAETFHSLKQNPNLWIQRRLPVDQKQSEYYYLFNFSIAACYRKTSLSSTLMHLWLQDLKSLSARGLAMITVSEAGQRLAHQLNMKSRSISNTHSISYWEAPLLT